MTYFGVWQEMEEGNVRWVVSPDLVHAQLKKIRSWPRLVGTEQRMLCGTREMLAEQNYTGVVCGRPSRRRL